MRILILIQNYPPEIGAMRYTHDLAVELANRKHDIHVITPIPHYPRGRPYPGYSRMKSTRVTEDGITVSRVPTVMGSNCQPYRRIAGFLGFMPSAGIAAFGNRRPDVIIASVPPPTIAFLAYTLGKLWRVPVVQMLRDVEPHISIQLRGYEQRCIPRVLIRAANYVYRRAARVVLVEPGHSSFLKNVVPPDKLKIIPRSIDIEYFQSQRFAHFDTTPLHRPGRALAVYLGTMGVVHDLHRVVRELASPAIRSLPIDFALIGDGECSKECEQIIEEQSLTNVRMLGSVPPSLVPAIMHKADLLLATFRDGTSAVGIKISEYFASGKPVLVTGRCSAGDLVREVGNGWVCETPDSENLYAALSTFLANRDSAGQKGMLGQAYARQYYSAKRQHDSWESLLLSLCRRPEGVHV